VAALAASNAFAQYSSSPGYGTGPDHKAEIIPMGGYAWTMSQEVYYGLTYGEIDLEDAAFYGVALDFNAARRSQKTSQVRLMYRRSDTRVVFRPSSFASEIDAAVEYWHIGGLGGIRRGNALPYASVTLGGTRFVVGDEDEWKFSMIFGLGVKIYTSPKIGVMIQGNWPITFTDAWGGVTVGTGGAGLSVGGTGISQLDVGGGLIICF
jgi:hypothetical protein